MFGSLKNWGRWRVIEHQVVQTLCDHEAFLSMSEATHYDYDNLNHVSLLKQKSSILKAQLIKSTFSNLEEESYSEIHKRFQLSYFLT